MNQNLLKWKSEYNTGDFKIDKEHQNLFLLAQKLLLFVETNNLKSDIQEFKNLIFELFTYVSEHFAHEEKYMKDIDYPEIKNHIALHKNMIFMLKKVLVESNSANIKNKKEELLQFINEYFVNHIILEDKKIKLFILPLDKLREHYGWKDSYSVNNESIDREHKMLFDIANKAFEFVNEKDRIKKIKNIVIDLYDYMKKHFKHEEEYMLRISYPQITEHKILHENIIEMLNKFVREISNISKILLEKEIARIIDIVLLEHIIKDDRKIVNFANSL